MDTLLRTIGTLTLLCFALAHGLVSTFKVDGYTIMLLLFAFIPWLYHDLQSLEVFGLFRMNLGKLDDKLSASDLGKVQEDDVPIKQSKDFYSKMAQDNPDMAVRGVKSDIDKGLVKIAEKYNLPTSGGRQQIVDSLVNAKQLSAEDKAVLRDIFKMYQKASTVVAKSSETVSWLINNGPRIARALELKLLA